MRRLLTDKRPPARVLSPRLHLSAHLGAVALLAATALARWRALAHPVVALAGAAMELALAALLAHEAAHGGGQGHRLAVATCSAAACALTAGLDGGMASALSGPLLLIVLVATLSQGSRALDVGAGAATGLLAAIPLARSHQLQLLELALAALAIAAAVRALERLLAQAREEADLDLLTGSLNRAAFARLASARLSGAQAEVRWGVVMVDLDDFGLLNKREGHLAGDRLLQLASRRLSAAAAPDGLVGRLGGDEFAALVPAPRAEALGRAVLSALLVGGEPISASIGVATAERGTSDWVALLREADVALRAAKRNGKGQCVTFADGIDAPEQLKRRHIREAIDEEAIEIVVQPIVDLRSGDIHAYEALARFQGPGPGSPAHWLSLAEPLGMRVELELACLRRSLRLLDEMPEGVRLSVNLSALALHDPRTRSMLMESRPELLIVELTEESLVQDARGLHSDLSALLASGTRLAVDDMGAGYSNLRQVVELAPSMLKLDRSLVHGIDRDPSQRLLIDALTGYAERTGAEIVAEGIETESELEVVRGLRIPYAQGYLLAMPGPPWPAVEIAQAPVRSRESATHWSRPVTISPQTTAEQARRRFAALPDLECLVLVDGRQRPLALITRHRLLTVLGHRFGHALWGEKPVARIADPNCLRLRADTSLDELARLSLARPVERRHDPVLLVDEHGRLAGQATMSDLLLGASPDSGALRRGRRTPQVEHAAPHRDTERAGFEPAMEC